MTMPESITLTQHMLGLKPYVLIEADTDPADGELVLSIKAGGGAAAEIGSLPFLMLTQLPADKNPLVMAIADLLDEHPGDVEAMTRLAELMGVPMPGAELADG